MLFSAFAVLLFCFARGEAISGVIRSVDPKSGTLTVDCSSPKGLVVSGFGVSGDLIPERVGTEIRADLHRSGSSARFENLVPADAAGDRLIAEAAARLRSDTERRGRAPKREMGEVLPEIALRDQFGRVFTNADTKGRYVIVNFIFTRCRAPEMCPASTRKMVALNSALRQGGVTDVISLSVSFDPGYDTPGILKSYADGYRADHASHRFLTGPKGAIDDLRRQFGILTVASDGTIVHNVATTLIGPDGKILYRADGPKWTPESILEKIPAYRPAR